MNKRILFVLEHFWPHVGGAETLFENVCAGLVSRGYIVTVVTTRLDDYKKHEVWREIDIHRVNCINRYGFTLFSLPRIYKLAKSADIIHTTTFNAALPAWIAAKILGKPCYITVLEVWGEFWKEISGFTLFHRLFEKIIMSLRFDKYIAISEYTKAQMQKIYNIREDKIQVIYPGIDYGIFDPGKYSKNKIHEELGCPTMDFFIYILDVPVMRKDYSIC